MLEFVEPVVLALTAGAAAGAGGVASTAVQDAYKGLKTAAGRVVRRKASSEGSVDEPDAVVEEQLLDPQAHRSQLEAALAHADPVEQAELLAAAHTLLELLDPQVREVGKYRVELRDNKGVQVGDHNTQTNTFS